MDYISISSFLRKVEKAKKPLTLVKTYNFQIRRLTEEDALNLSEYFLVLVFLMMKKILNKKIKHISLSGVSYIFLWGIYFLQWIFLVGFWL